MKTNKAIWFTSILCLLPIVIGIILWDKLPEQMTVICIFKMAQNWKALTRLSLSY